MSVAANMESRFAQAKRMMAESKEPDGDRPRANARESKRNTQTSIEEWFSPKATSSGPSKRMGAGRDKPERPSRSQARLPSKMQQPGAKKLNRPVVSKPQRHASKAKTLKPKQSQPSAPVAPPRRASLEHTPLAQAWKSVFVEQPIVRCNESAATRNAQTQDVENRAGGNNHLDVSVCKPIDKKKGPAEEDKVKTRSPRPKPPVPSKPASQVLNHKRDAVASAPPRKVADTNLEKEKGRGPEIKALNPIKLESTTKNVQGSRCSSNSGSLKPEKEKMPKIIKSYHEEQAKDGSLDANSVGANVQILWRGIEYTRLHFAAIHVAWSQVRQLRDQAKDQPCKEMMIVDLGALTKEDGETPLFGENFEAVFGKVFVNAFIPLVHSKFNGKGDLDQTLLPRDIASCFKLLVLAERFDATIKHDIFEHLRGATPEKNGQDRGDQGVSSSIPFQMVATSLTFAEAAPASSLQERIVEEAVEKLISNLPQSLAALESLVELSVKHRRPDIAVKLFQKTTRSCLEAACIAREQSSLNARQLVESFAASLDVSSRHQQHLDLVAQAMSGASNSIKETIKVDLASHANAAVEAGFRQGIVLQKIGFGSFGGPRIVRLTADAIKWKRHGRRDGKSIARQDIVAISAVDSDTANRTLRISSKKQGLHSFRAESPEVRDQCVDALKCWWRPDDLLQQRRSQIGQRCSLPKTFSLDFGREISTQRAQNTRSAPDLRLTVPSSSTPLSSAKLSDNVPESLQVTSRTQATSSPVSLASSPGASSSCSDSKDTAPTAKDQEASPQTPPEPHRFQVQRNFGVPNGVRRDDPRPSSPVEQQHELQQQHMPFDQEKTTTLESIPPPPTNLLMPPPPPASDTGNNTSSRQGSFKGLGGRNKSSFFSKFKKGKKGGEGGENLGPVANLMRSPSHGRSDSFNFGTRQDDQDVILDRHDDSLSNDEGGGAVAPDDSDEESPML